MRSIDAVSLELSRGSFKLLADNAAFVVLEEEHNIPLKEVGNVVFDEDTRIKRLCEVAAVFARNSPGQGEVKASDILGAAPTPEDLGKLRVALMTALANYLPPKKPGDDAGKSEGGDNAPERPLGNA